MPMTPVAHSEIESRHLVALDGGASAMRNGAARRHAAVLRLGDLLVAEGLTTHAQIQKALRVQSQSKTYMLLGHILVSQKIITRNQLLSVLDRHRRRSKLGELLVKSGAITPYQLETALAEQRRWKQTLGEVVVRLRYVTEEQVRRALCQQLHINYFDLDTIVLDRTLCSLINPRFAKKRLVVPIARVGQTLVVAMDDPTRTPVIDDLKASTGLDIEVITSTTASIRRALEHMYALTENQAPERPGLVAVDHGIQTRFRIDGVLQELGLDDLDELMNQNRGKLLSRLKILSKLDIAERRRPQDGSFRARLTRDGQTA